ncbi:MAG: hypothetical protein NC222_06470 [Staphylococcus sp.]|nr:hypothetical protein [Staphylococcus sp.]
MAKSKNRDSFIMIIELKQPCKDLMYCDFEDKTILSWELDTQQIKEKLQELSFQKIYDFKENIDFLIEIDSTPEFNSINLQTYNFKDLEQYYTGNCVYSCILKIAEKQLSEESKFYYRVKINPKSIKFIVKQSDDVIYYDFEFNSDWGETSEITIKKNYTLDILHSMYNFISDYNAYNKEIKSANFYNFLLPHAKEFNKSFEEIMLSKELFFLDKCNSNKLDEIYGNNYGFNIPFNMNAEEYRRLMISLRKAYTNAGTYHSINSVLKYFFGENANFNDFRKIYPWILRSKKIKDPENPSYTNFKSNYYLYEEKLKDYPLQKNRIMLLDENIRKFCFLIKIDNFFNVEYNKKDIKTIINKLKPVYTKYVLKIEEKEDFKIFK